MISIGNDITVASFDTEHWDYAVFWWAKERLPLSVQQSLKEVS